jgi:outer membrane protein assembly factor BamB
MKKHLLICCVILLLLSSSFVGVSKQIEIKEESTQNSPPMDSAWPIHGHDIYHSGQSPYITTETSSFEKWRFETYGWAQSSPAIDNEGTIYIGAYNFYAVYPNGSMKWMYDTGGVIKNSCPAIDENGVIYIGTSYDLVHGNRLYAFYPDGSLKWTYFIGDSTTSSPVIGEDGVIYFGDWNGDFHAVYSNGTRKWKYHTSDVITSSPAIGVDGTIFIGSHDNYVYAFYPDNGSVKWKYNTGSWVHGIPTIGTDGTVYIGSDNGYLYAFYPNNGTVKWKLNIGPIWASPSLDEEDTLYVGSWNKKFYAIYPNGTMKWSFNAEEKIWSSTACISADGTIYFGTCDLENEGGLDIVVLNPNGTLKWRRHIGSLFSSPAIGANGDVYIGASTVNDGYLYAFGKVDNYPPSAPTIDGPTGVPPGTYEYTFKATDPDGDNVSYTIDWGDATSDETMFYKSGEEVTVSHTYSSRGGYIITAYAKDIHGLIGPSGTNPVEISRDKSTNNNVLFWRIIERFPLLSRLLNIGWWNLE